MLTIVKVGGKIVETPQQLKALLHAFAALPGRKILVHGGGRSATDMATRLGIPTQMVAGRRITDEAMLEVVTMVYGGGVNKRIVARLQACGVNALGMTGADAGIIRAHRRPKGEVDYGFVGDVDAVDDAALARLLDQGLTPIIAPLTLDAGGNLLNTNADTIAGEVAAAMARREDVRLIYCFEHAGCLRNPDDETSVIPHIDREGFARLTDEGVISGGMIPKVENCLRAVESGVRQVRITRLEQPVDGPARFAPGTAFGDC